MQLQKILNLNSQLTFWHDRLDSGKNTGVDVTTLLSEIDNSVALSTKKLLFKIVTHDNLKLDRRAWLLKKLDFKDVPINLPCKNIWAEYIRSVNLNKETPEFKNLFDTLDPRKTEFSKLAKTESVYRKNSRILLYLLCLEQSSVFSQTIKSVDDVEHILIDSSKNKCKTPLEKLILFRKSKGSELPIIYYNNAELDSRILYPNGNIYLMLNMLNNKEKDESFIEMLYEEVINISNISLQEIKKCSGTLFDKYLPKNTEDILNFELDKNDEHDLSHILSWASIIDIDYSLLEDSPHFEQVFMNNIEYIKKLSSKQLLQLINCNIERHTLLPIHQLIGKLSEDEIDSIKNEPKLHLALWTELKDLEKDAIWSILEDNNAIKWLAILYPDVQLVDDASLLNCLKPIKPELSDKFDDAFKIIESLNIPLNEQFGVIWYAMEQKLNNFEFTNFEHAHTP